MYDLILKDGTVVDPAQDIHAKRDVAFKDGKIACIAATIPEDQAKETVDVGGKLVTPGLIDFHAHVYWGGTTLGIKPDLVGSVTGVTTFVDAGSAGAGNFVGFKEHIIDRSQTRIYAFLHISYLGLHGAVYDPENFVILGEMFEPRYGMIQPAVDMGRTFPDRIVGIKVRCSIESSGNYGIQALRLAIQAAEDLGKPVMVHVGPPPPSRREILSLLREGDVLTHAFRGSPNGPLDRQGRILPEMREARERGIIMDLGHGGSSFSWDVAARMLEQGFLPEIISSDIHIGIKVKTGGWPGMPPRNQLLAMSKMLSLGMSLDDVVRASTHTPASVIGCEDQLGSLREGTLADVTVLDLSTGDFEFEDRYSGKTSGTKSLRAVMAFVEGEVLRNGAPSPQPRF